MRLFLALLIFSISTISLASWNQGNQKETGGEGFHIVKLWGGSAGTVLRIEYYGYLSLRCNAGKGAGHVNNLNFFIQLNGKQSILQETSCESYMDNDTQKTYVVTEVRSDDNPIFFEGIDKEGIWNLSIYIKSIYGEYDSRFGQNYHFSL